MASGIGLVGHGTHHKLVDAVCVGIVGQVFDVGQRVFVGNIGEGFAGGYLFAVDMGRRRALLDVVVALGLVAPELTLWLVDQLFHLDGITRHAECAANGLRRQRQSFSATEAVELAVVAVGDEVADGAAKVG